MRERPIVETVQRLVRTTGGEDAHGNPTVTWSAPTPVGVYGFDPGSSGEPRRPGQDRVITEPTLYLPSAEVFAPGDRVICRAREYEVEGETREWRSPSFQGNVVTLRRVTG